MIMHFSCYLVVFRLEDVATFLSDYGVRPSSLIRDWCLFGLVILNGRHSFLGLLNELHPGLLQFFDRSHVNLSHIVLLLVALIDVLGDCLGLLKDVGLALLVLDLVAVESQRWLFKCVSFFRRALQGFLLAQSGGAHFVANLRRYSNQVVVFVVVIFGHARCLQICFFFGLCLERPALVLLG